MSNSPGMSAVGIGGIGFGVVLIWAAYTNKPLFGPDGLINLAIGGTIDGAAVGRAVGKGLNDAAKTFPSSQPTPPSSIPPGSVWT